MIQKPRLVMQHYQPLMPTSQFQGISKFQFRKMWMSQFKKILNQNFKKLILVCWSEILDCINKYEIIMLINVMKSDELTVTMVFSNPNCLHTKNPDQKSIIVAFNTLGSNSFQHGLNILLRKMQHFVFHVFSFISHLGILD